jgi:hypothetical protein
MNNTPDQKLDKILDKIIMIRISDIKGCYFDIYIKA